jgi:Domain of unknown function (DUF4136)
MRHSWNLVLASALLLGSAAVALAGDVRTDYNHSTNFTQYHTYCWGNVKTTDPFFVNRLQQAVNSQLKAKGWKLAPSGGAVTIFATDNIHNQQEVQTMYDGLGVGWGGGWGWGGWGWGGGWAAPAFGQSTTTTSDQPVANLVVDIFEAGSKNLLWRGLATEDLSTHADKNTKSLDGDIKKMFRDFPPKPNSQ